MKMPSLGTSFLKSVEYLTVKETALYTFYAITVCATVAITSLAFDRIIQTFWTLF